MNPDAPRILVFAGSTRRDSLNKRLARAARGAVRAKGGAPTWLDLAERPMPLYDGDLEKEHGLPENAKRFKQLLKEHAGLVIANPEYNSSISGVLKNAIDWASRQEPGEAPLACFDRKVAGLCAASPGALGGLRSLVVLRMLLANIRVLVVPEQLAVGKAHEAFGADGNLADAKQQASLEAIAARVVALCRASA